MKTVNLQKDVTMDVMGLFLSTFTTVWILQYIVLVGRLFYAGSHNFS